MRTRWSNPLAGTLLLLFMGVPGLAAQGSDAYLAAVARHYEIPSSEIGILSEWTVPADEIPVVLFVSSRGGASRDALLALRRRGQPWSAIAERYQVDAATFHYPVGEIPSAGVLASTYLTFRETPRGDWGSIRLDDAAIIALVNLRFLAEHLRQDPSRVAAEMARGGSAAEVLGRLGG